MDPTRRYWQAVCFEVLLAGAALLYERPLLIAGAVLVGAFLLAMQFDFAESVAATADALTVTQTLTPRQATVGETVQATLDVALAAPSPERLTVTMQPPPGVRVQDTDATTVTLAPGQRRTSTTVPVDLPVGGTHTVDRPAVTVTDSHGWLETTRRSGQPETLVAQPQVPRNVHVGQGGEELAAGFGDHRAGQLGTGVEPAELREYEPGESVSRIDWKATARLDEPYIQEFETETDHTLGFVVDHRAGMGEGVGGQTKLMYAREVALAILEHAREANDPVGLVTVGDGGLTASHQPSATNHHYEQLRLAIAEAEPTAAAATDAGSAALAPGRTPQEATTAAGQLSGADSQFATTVGPFLATSETYVERVQDTPLFGAIQSRIRSQQGIDRVLLFTDDTNRAEVIEAAKLAQQGGTQVLVFLTPSVLFSAGVLSDLDGAYDQYLDFESFRRTLDRISNVSAFEVGPGDRVAAILEARQKRRGTA